MSEIKNLRNEKMMTQQQAADYLGISVRSFKSYENDPKKKDTLKYKYIIEKLKAINPIDEEHGILDIEFITNKCSEVFEEYQVHYCILFGSYAKGNATESSDVDLLVASDVKGIKFFGLVERIRTVLKKKVDVLNLEQLKNNFELTNEILQDGIRIYG